MPTHATHPFRFSSEADHDEVIRSTLGRTTAGAADVGEVLAAVQGVRGKDHDGWFAAWRGLGDRVAAQGDAAAAGGHRASAASAYLRASAYLAVAVNAVAALESDDDLLPTFRAHRRAWDAWVAHSDLDVVPVDVPYEGDALPAFLFRAPGGGAQPTVVAVNGSDGSLTSLWVECVAGALRRGYHALVFDGPGQQSMLFERAVPFRPDWEKVLTPVLDVVLARPEVDAEHVAVYGVSQAGYWVARALAFEHRPVAAVVDPGVVDVAASWERAIPGSLLTLLDKDEDHAFDRDMALGMRLSPATARTWRFRARPYGTEGYAATVREVRRYDAADVAARITTPLLVTDPEGETFWPGQSRRLAALTPEVSTLVPFTAAEGADGHCQPLARALTEQRVYDWLDGYLRS
ncbi:alpha/beta hydrolase family protein [Cellulomonas pakistanensis]|uniref:Dipeptidyl aminopeptidase n=1 Tax=Cellulomonas pakistanensis TaxID=992287 RepID=A0A919PDX3_9CELL|nr:dipeptidyl aminopeptidase [Cellulomonas pakistanensis]GIG37790.1 dipeptidyl aminopeptidase [Cellulomonas pakistanensis]